MNTGKSSENPPMEVRSCITCLVMWLHWKRKQTQEVIYLHLLQLRKHECIHGGSMIIELWLDTLYKRSAETALFLSLQLLQTDILQTVCKLQVLIPAEKKVTSQSYLVYCAVNQAKLKEV